MNEQIANLSREIKTVKKNLVGILELKTWIANMKSDTDSFKWQIRDIEEPVGLKINQ